jgi:acetylxylan esterase
MIILRDHTSDTTLNYHNFGEGIKQWTNVFGYSETPTEVDTNWPLANWTRSIYGPNFQAISAAGVDHNIQIQADQVLDWFGITGGGSTPPTSSPPTTTPPATTTPTPTTTSPNQPAQSQWGQCGG